jgi:hypothetical protein
MGNPVDPLPERLPAEVYQWGSPKAEFRVPDVWKTVGGILLLSLAIGLISALVLFIAGSEDTVRISIAIAVLVAAFLFYPAWLFRQWRNRGLRVWVFPQGFLWTQGARVKVVRWGEVETVTKEMLHVYRSAKQPRFTVKLLNGEEIRFEALEGMDELGNVLETGAKEGIVGNRGQKGKS